MKSVNSTTLPLINNINRKLIYQFTLDGKNLPLSDIMDNLTLTWDIGLEQYSIGNVYIRELQFSVKNTVFVNYKSKINISVKIEGDSYTYNLGKFYVDTVTEQGVTKQIKAYDDMFLLNVGYFPSAKHTTTKAIIDDIVSQKGLTLVGWNNRTANINNEQLEGKTILEMLKLVSCVHGGTFFFDGDGALKFVQTNDTRITYTKSDYATPTLDTSISYKITKLKVIYGEKILNDDEEGTVKDEGFYEVGEGLDAQTLAISNVLLKGQQAQAQRILDSIKTMNGYKRFDTTVLLGDFRLEPMDLVTYVKDDISYKVPIIYLKATLSHGGLLVETKSPTLAESKNEFSFKGTLTQKVDNIYTDIIQVKDIVANSITVGDLNAINAKIENLEATDATITNLLAGNITSENIQSGSITSDRLVIDDGFVKDAMIDTISANKIMSGSIDTGAITIQSDNGRMIIADETIQISDGTHVRVQIGETGNGDYALVIYDANGNVMFDATGITENAIKSAIIKDNMVADNANINAQKIDINSLFTVINEDGSHTLNGSKIFLDTQQQTLNVAFNNMTTKQDDLEEQTNVLSTQVNVQSGKIETLIQDNTITEDGVTTTLKGYVSKLKQDVNKISLEVGETNTWMNNFTVGSRNLVRNSAFLWSEKIEENVYSFDYWNRRGGSPLLDTNNTFNGHPSIKIKSESRLNIGLHGIYQRFTSQEKMGDTITVSCWYYVEDKSLFTYTTDTGGKSYTKICCMLMYDCDNGKEGIYKEPYIPIRTYTILTEEIIEKQWTKIEFSSTVGEVSETKPLAVFIGVRSTTSLGAKCDINFTDVMATYGDKITTWIPAPEDAETQIEKIEIGGVNRLSGTSTPYAIELNVPDSSKSFTPYFTPYQKTLKELGFKVGDKLTLSLKYDSFHLGDIMDTETDDGIINVALCGKTYSDGEVQNVYVKICDFEPIKDAFSLYRKNYRHESTLTVTEPMLYAYGVQFTDENVNYGLILKEMQLEKGDKATDWTIAPEDIQADINFLNTEVKQTKAKLEVNTNSINASVEEIRKVVNSGFDGISSDIESLTKRVDATMTSEDIKFEISKEMSNGITTVKTATGFTFNEDGLNISKSDSEMNTQITEDGMTITKNDETVLTANNKGVQAKNLYATTYLIVGNSRFESYKGNRTGCFYVFEPSINMAEETNLLNEEGEE